MVAYRVDHLGKNSFHHVRRFRIPTRITIIDYLFCIDFSSHSFYLHLPGYLEATRCNICIIEIDAKIVQTDMEGSH